MLANRYSAPLASSMPTYRNDPVLTRVKSHAKLVAKDTRLIWSTVMCYFVCIRTNIRCTYMYEFISHSKMVLNFLILIFMVMKKYVRRQIFNALCFLDILIQGSFKGQ